MTGKDLAKTRAPQGMGITTLEASRRPQGFYMGALLADHAFRVYRAYRV